MTETPKPSVTRQIEYVSGDTTIPGAWQENFTKKDAVINLAGASIFQQWNDTRKQLMYNSRILTTHTVVEAMVGEKAPCFAIHRQRDTAVSEEMRR